VQTGGREHSCPTGYLLDEHCVGVYICFSSSDESARKTFLPELGLSNDFMSPVTVTWSRVKEERIPPRP
jgi:hypothetical protein